VIPVDQPPPIEVRADQIVFDRERVVATGGVVLVRAGQRVEADRAVLTLDDRVLVLQGGTLTQADLVLVFDTAAVRLEAEAAHLEGVAADLGGWHAEGAVVVVGPDGTLTIEQAVATACDPGCGLRRPWEVVADQATLDGDGTLAWRRAWFYLWGVPVLPLPAGRTPTDPYRFRVGLPALGWVDGRPAVLLPASWGHPSGLWMTGAVGTWRGPRTRVEASWRDTSWLRVDASMDERGRRAGVALSHVQVSGDLRLGVDGRLVSDPLWLADHQPTLVERSAPWTELRAIAGFGPGRLELTGYQTEAPEVAWTPAMVLTTPTRDLGPLQLDGTARFDLVDGEIRSEARGAVRWLSTGGVGEAEVEGSARALSYGGEPGGLDARLAAEARLPTWRDGVLGRQEWVLGARAQVGAHRGAPLRHPWEAWEEGLQVGPQVQTVAWGPAGTQAWASVWVPWTAEGWSLRGAGRLSRGPLQVGAQARWRDDQGLVGSSVTWTGSRGGLWGEAALVGEEDLAPFGRVGGWWRWAGPRSAFRLEGWALADDQGAADARLGLAWASACDCLEVGTAVGWATDQQGPSVSLRVSLDPDGRGE